MKTSALVRTQSALKRAVSVFAYLVGLAEHRFCPLCYETGSSTGAGGDSGRQQNCSSRRVIHGTAVRTLLVLALLSFGLTAFAQDMATTKQKAEQGDAAAQLFLGILYKDGQGVPQDYAQAAIWFRKAAEQGDAGAQFMLGASYANGKGVPQDYAQAAVWFRKAAEQGNATAQILLGILY